MRFLRFIIRYWRRPRMLVKEAGIYAALQVIAFANLFHSDIGSEIGVRDQLRWMIEGWGERIFARFFPKSDSEMAQLISGCIPWEYLDARQRAISADLGWTEEELR